MCVHIHKEIAYAIDLHYDPSLPQEYKKHGKTHAVHGNLLLVLLPREYKKHGKTIRMDGYTIREITYPGAPNRSVTGNLFVPEGEWKVLSQ